MTTSLRFEPRALPEHLLGLAGGVNVGRVEEVDAGVQSLIHQLIRQRGADLRDRSEDAGAGTEGHRAERQARNDQTGITHSCILHGLQFRKVSISDVMMQMDSVATATAEALPVRR